MMTMSDYHEILRAYNDKVKRLEDTRMYQRYAESTPKVVCIVQDFKFGEFKNCHGEFIAHFRSWLEDFDQDDIDAFVLSYRILTQDNDRLSVGSLGRIYDLNWIPREAADKFREARTQLNDYLDNTTTTVTVGCPVRIRELLDVIIYGALAHSNPTKEATFKEWTRDGGLTGFFWGEFIAALKEVMRHLIYFKELNVAVLANTNLEVTGQTDESEPD